MTKQQANETSFDNMKVASYNYGNFGDTDDISSNWHILMKENTFVHSECCEIILYVDNQGDEEGWQEWRRRKIPEDVIQLAKDAQAQGYMYLCLYA